MTQYQLSPDKLALDQEEADISKVSPIYSRPMPSARSGPLYNAFSYPTKISPEVIALFIATHTAPGASVLDVFAGSGTTGVAALLCDNPTTSMKDMASNLGLDPKWGPRHAHLVEVGTLGCFISKVLTSKIDPESFSNAASYLLEQAEQRLKGMYEVEDLDGNSGLIRHVIWSDVLVCQSCSREHRLWDVAAQRNPAAFLNKFSCPDCSYAQNVADCERVEQTSTDVFGKLVRSRLRVPVEVHGVSGNKKWRRAATEKDAHAKVWKGYRIPKAAPDMPIAWGELNRTGYHRGIDHLHHFYTPRNFIAIATCLEIAEEFPEPIASALKFLVLSYNASHSTLMTRIVAKKNQSDFVLTGAQSGVLYVSGLPVEKNILLGLRRKASVIKNAFSLLSKSQSSVEVHNLSSEKLPIASSSIEYVFTDPPFGDYIPYAELNQINEIWLGNITDRRAETVVSKSGDKNEDHYEASMTRVFTEVARVLKPDGLATVVFHSAHSKIWQALISSYANSGLRVVKTSVLDKIQSSFKQVVSKVSVKGDPLILLKKGSSEPSDNEEASLILSKLRAEYESSPSQDIRSYFSRYIAESIAAGQPISLNASDFARHLSPTSVQN